MRHFAGSICLGGFFAYRRFLDCDAQSTKMLTTPIAPTSSPQMREAMRVFVAPDTLQALFVVCVDYLLYALFVLAAISVDATWLRFLAAIGAGAMISALFVLGHDAAHNSL